MTGERVDPVGQAIAGAGEPTHFPPMVEIPILITSTGRPAMIVLPADISVEEVGELAAWILTTARRHIAEDARRSRIVVARDVVVHR